MPAGRGHACPLMDTIGNVSATTVPLVSMKMTGPINRRGIRLPISTPDQRHGGEYDLFYEIVCSSQPMKRLAGLRQYPPRHHGSLCTGDKSKHPIVVRLPSWLHAGVRYDSDAMAGEEITRNAWQTRLGSPYLSSSQSHNRR